MFGLFSKQFVKDLKPEISNQNVYCGAAAFAFCVMRSIFRATVFVPSLSPCIPILNPEQAILNLKLIGPVLPQETAKPFTGISDGVSSRKQWQTFSFGLPFLLCRLRMVHAILD